MKLLLEWKYRAKNGATATFHSEQLTAAEALMLAEDIENTGRVKQLIMTDEHDSTWMMKELRKYLKELETEPHDITVYFDGGYHHDEYTAGLGIVIYYKQNNKRYRYRKNLLLEQIDSNNEAEYAALHLAIAELELLQAHHQTISIKGDSQVVINQLNGEWPAYEEKLASWATKIEKRLQHLGFIPEYKLLSRNDNKEADRLATQALEGTSIEATIVIN